jgi:ATP-dependent Lon protease
MEVEDVQIAASEEIVSLPDSLPVLPLRDIVIFPYMIVPLFVQRERSMRAVDQALAENRMILLVAQRDLEKEEPSGADLFDYGTAATIMRMLKMPDGRIRILVQGLSRARVLHYDSSQPHLMARIEPLSDTEPDIDDLELEALMRSVRSSLERAITLGKNISSEVMAIVANLEDPGRLADVAISNLELKVSDAQSVLEKLDPAERLRRVNELLAREIKVLMVQQEIDTQAKGEIDRSQREFYLRQQLKAIQVELGEGNELAEEIAQYRAKMIEARMPKDVE